MKCVFERRIGDNALDFRRIFSGMRVIQAVGNNTSAGGQYRLSGTNVSAVTGTAYIFSFYGGYLGLWRVVAGVVDSTPVVKMNSTRGGIWVNSTNNNVSYNATYRYDANEGSNTDRQGTLVLVDFPGFSASAVEYVLANATYTRLAGTEGTGTATVRATISTVLTHEGALAARAAYFDAWSPNGGGSVEKIGGTTPNNAATASSTYLSVGSVYNGSIIGLN